MAKRTPGLLAILLMTLLAGCAAENNVTKTPVPPPPAQAPQPPRLAP